MATDQANHHVADDNTFILGSRNSHLALVQTSIVKSRLEALFPSRTFLVSGMTTTGDRDLNSPLYLMGGKALWTKDLEVAMLSGAVDMVVHSLKDVPTVLPEGCELGAVMAREDPRDALVVKEGLGYKELKELPEGSVVGTSSVRRVAQLRRRYPGLQFKDIRGNLQTRLGKLDSPSSPFTAIILAVAGLARIDLSHRITSYLSPPDLYHAVGQGALGVEIRTLGWEPPAEAAEEIRVQHERAGRKGRSGEEVQERVRVVKEMVDALEDWQTAWRCEAERELLRTLEGGCSVPVGCYTSFTPSSSSSSRSGSLTLEAVVTSLSGTQETHSSQTSHITSVSQAIALGHQVAHDLKSKGAYAILEGIERMKQEGEAKIEEANGVKSPSPAGRVDEAGLTRSPEIGTRAQAVEEVMDTKIVDLEPQSHPEHPAV